MLLPRWLQNVGFLIETFCSVYWLFKLHWP
jgi:hypothetical protein